MSTIGTKIANEFRALLPVMLYFLFANELLALTHSVLLSEYGITVSSFFRAVVIALVVAKVVLIVDHTPLMKAFKNKPAIYATLWSACVYFVASVIIQFIEGVVHPLIALGDVGAAYQQFISETVWHRFWLVQLWLFVLLFNYCFIREMVKVMGRGEVTRRFFKEAN